MILLMMSLLLPAPAPCGALLMELSDYGRPEEANRRSNDAAADAPFS
jgi:hypothetical protein